MKEITLKVDSAYPEDQGSGKARLDPAVMRELDVMPGDIIKIIGKTETAAKVWRALPNDRLTEKIRIDKYTRNNAGVILGDKVKISRIDKQDHADIIRISPPEDMPVPPEYLSRDVKDILDLNSLSNFAVSVDDILPVRTYLSMNTMIEFKITSIEPKDACLISLNTEFEFDKPLSGFSGIKNVTYEDIGGLKNEIRRVREMIELPIRHPELFKTMGIDAPKGVLLYGAPGTGKTLIAKAVANESGANFISIAGPEIISKYYGESEQKLREIFDEAEENAPSIIFIDELDSIAPRREDVTGEVERRVVAQLLTMLDGISDRGQVIVIGATNRPEAIDSALRRPGRFDREIEIGVPSESDRLEILRIHTKNMPFEGHCKLMALQEQKPSQIVLEQAYKTYNDEKEKLLARLASVSKGYVGADLAALAREGAVAALRRQIGLDIDIEKIPDSELNKLEVKEEDFMRVAREMIPSAMREISIDTSNVHWSDIGGSADVIRDVREYVEYPLTKKEKFSALGIKPPKGILLYGPPGTGKTLIAKAAANESGANFIAVKGPQLLSKWVGESERAVREMFKKARLVAPSIIFFDEIDSLSSAKGSDTSHVSENVLNQILTEMDGIEELNDVVILAASNRPDIIDPALLRSGRFDRLVYISHPNKSEREEILKIHMKYMPIADSAFETVVSALCGMTFDDISALAEKLKGRTLTAKQVISAAKKYGRAEGRTAYDTRKIIVPAFENFGVSVKDPVRDELISEIAENTEGFVGSDLEGLCRESAMLAMRRNSESVSASDFKEAGRNIHPTMNPSVLEYYERINRSFKGGLSKEVQNLMEYQ